MARIGKQPKKDIAIVRNNHLILVFDIVVVALRYVIVGIINVIPLPTKPLTYVACLLP